MKKIVKKEICKCTNCGNEAEMVITCSLPDVDEGDRTPSASRPPDRQSTKKRVKGTATCSHCGNEADMWIDY